MLAAWNLSCASNHRAVFQPPQTPPVSICFPTSRVNTTLLEGPSFTIYLKGWLLPPVSPFVHHFSLHISPLIVLRINRRHIYTVDISASKWKTSWTEKNSLSHSENETSCISRFLPPYLEASVLLQGGFVVIHSSSLAFFKVILTICKLEISHKSVFWWCIGHKAKVRVHSANGVLNKFT